MAILKVKDGAEWKEIQAIKGADGTDGTDGLSPTVETSKSGKTTTITITDIEGEHVATILDGEDGASEWGDISGTLSNQTDLQNALNEKADISSLPSKTSDLTNDSGFITSSSLPTKVSDLTNDTGFITSTVNNLTNYYTKSNTYTKTEVDNLIAQVNSLKIEIVQTLPTQDIDTHTIYLVPKTGSTGDVYNEYIYVSNSWELIGSTEVDLTNYYNKTETLGLLAEKVSRLLETEESGVNYYGQVENTSHGNYMLTAESSENDAYQNYIYNTNRGTTILNEGNVGGEYSSSSIASNLDEIEIKHIEGEQEEETGSILIDENGTSIKGVITPTTNDMAANKAYVDAGLSSKADASSLPTKVSDLTNDVGFITNTVDNLTNYYTKTETNSTIKEMLPVVKSLLENPLGIEYTLITNKGTEDNPVILSDLKPGIYFITKNDEIVLKADSSIQDTYTLLNLMEGMLYVVNTYSSDLPNYTPLFYYIGHTNDNRLTIYACCVRTEYDRKLTSLIVGDYYQSEYHNPYQNATFKNGATFLNKLPKVHFQLVPTENNELIPKSYVDTGLSGKQDTLVSGTNIKTINNQSLLGNGNITISSGGTSTDVQVNGTSIVSNNVANLVTEGVYDSTTNKIATISDLPTVPTNVSSFTNDAGYLTSYTETDPVFTASAAYGISSSDITSWNGKIDKNVNDLTNYYTKTEVDGKVSSVYKYKGSVATYSDLPSTGLTIGDVYNVESDGSNYAWTGTTWDALGGTVDLSGYQTKIDSSHKLSSDLVDDTNHTNKFVTASDKTTWNGKQDALVSGTNIKTINNQSLLGSGNISIDTSGATWGSITGTLSNQTDLQTALNNKTEKIVQKTQNNIDYTGVVTNEGNSVGIEAMSSLYDRQSTLSVGNSRVTIDTFEDNNDVIKQSILHLGEGSTSISYEQDGDEIGSVVIDTTGTIIKGVVTPTTNDMATNKSYVDTAVSSKQDTLVSGTNIKTINNTSLLGSGDLTIKDIKTLIGTQAEPINLNTIEKGIYFITGYVTIGTNTGDNTTSGNGNGRTYIVTEYSTKTNPQRQIYISDTSAPDYGFDLYIITKTGNTYSSSSNGGLLPARKIKYINGTSLVGTGNISVRENNIITAQNSSTVTTGLNTYDKIPLELKTSIGTKLTIDSTNNGVKIGSGVSYVKVSGSITFGTRAGTSRHAIIIRKNTTAVANTIARLGGNWETVLAGETLIDVQEGDIIYLYVRTQDASGGVTDASFLTVEAVE